MLRHRTDTRRTKQVGRHQAVSFSGAKLSNLDGRRAQWPGRSTETDLDFARRRQHKGQRDTPPVNGVRGKPPMSARSAKALIEGGPGDSLVTF